MAGNLGMGWRRRWEGREGRDESGLRPMHTGVARKENCSCGGTEDGRESGHAVGGHKMTDG